MSTGTAHLEYRKRVNKRTKAQAKHGWKRWTPDEIAYLLESDEKLETIAINLGRSYRGCREKRKKLRREIRRREKEADMARAHFVAKARKDNPVAMKGESYWWWKFRFGPKRYSKEPPKRWMLTQSNFYSQLWQLEDSYETEVSNAKDLQEIDDLIHQMIDDLEALMDECQESLDNMPEALQEASMSGEILQERIEGLESWVSELQSIELDMEEPEDDDLLPDEDEIEAHLESIKEEVLAANPGLG